MARHHFEPTRFHSTFGSHEAVLTVASGDTIDTWTVDADGVDRNNRKLARGSNPLTGPFYVDGAEPGDRLIVRIDRLVPNRATGFGRASLAQNVVDPSYVTEMGYQPSPRDARWSIDSQAGTVTLNRDEGPLAGFSLPWAPMLGCLGVAPAGGEAISSATSGSHGGNMDVRRLGAGATVTFPVHVQGALLFLGDAHALQGDGEMSGTGVETSVDVGLIVTVEKGRPAVEWPRGETDRFRFTMGNARPLDQAAQHATTEMMRWLIEDTGLSPADAGLFLSQTVRYEIGNMYDPAYTMVCRLPHEVVRRLDRVHD